SRPVRLDARRHGNLRRADVVVSATEASVEGWSLEECELVEQAKRGVVEAYEDLIRKYQDVAFRTAYVLLGDAAAAEDATQALLAAVNQLREEERLAITYRYFLDLSELELAATLGCARGTVKSRLSRALGRLRALIADPRSDDAPRSAPSHPKGATGD